MEVLRKMIILSGFEDSSQGVVKLEKIGARTLAHIHLYREVGQDFKVCLQHGDEKPYFLPISSKKHSCELAQPRLDMDVKCAVFDGNKPVLAGSTGAINVAQFLSLVLPLLEEKYPKAKPVASASNEDGKVVSNIKSEGALDNAKTVTSNASKEKKLGSEGRATADYVLEYSDIKQSTTARAVREEVLKQDFPNQKGSVRANAVEKNSEGKTSQRPSSAKIQSANNTVKTARTSGNDKLNYAKADAVRKDKVEVADVIDYSTEHPFYNIVREQIERMFAEYPAFDAIAERVPSSKWIKVDTDGDFYVIGIIFEDEKPRYLCYGVPANKEEIPPEKVDENCQWVSFDDNNDGYYMMYQDAINGETVLSLI